MQALRLLWLFFSLIALTYNLPQACAQGPQRALVHLMSYLAQDYSGAVSEGKVLNQFEYDEQKEFAASALELGQDFARLHPEQEGQDVLKKIQNLQQMINSKASGEAVKESALGISRSIIAITSLAVAPKKWPSREHGKEIFKQNCQLCHGASGRGDGEGAVGMNPPAANFWDQERMPTLSAFGAFNTISLGVNGTGMPSFAQALSEEDIWDVAFYVMGLRHEEAAKSLNPKDIGLDLSLEEVATLNEEEQLDLLQNKRQKNNQQALKAIVLARVSTQGPSGPQGGSGTGASKALELMNDSYKAFKSLDFKSAKDLALRAYLEGLEPVEPKLAHLDKDLLHQVEASMALWRQEIALAQKSATPNNQADQSYQKALSDVQKAHQLLLSATSSQSWMSTFVLSAGIVLREGLEAMLVVVSILMVAKASGVPLSGLMWIHAGWLSAIMLGVLGWFFSSLLMQGMQREMMEGLAALIAVLALLYMGHWLHSKSEIDKWNAFLKEKTKNALTQEKLMALGSISFIAVFRESFESVIFLRALAPVDDGTSSSAILAGVLLACALAIVLGLLAMRLGKKMPLARLFSLSSLIMLVLAVILAGKGVHSFQEIDFVGQNILHGAPRFDLLGVFPTWQTMGLQLLTLIVAGLLWGRSRRQMRTKPSLS